MLEKENELYKAVEKLEAIRRENEAERDGLLAQLQEAEQEKSSVSAKLEVKVAEFEVLKTDILSIKSDILAKDKKILDIEELQLKEKADHHAEIKRLETELKARKGLEAELKEQEAKTAAAQEELARLKVSYQDEINKAYIEGGEDAAPLYEAQVESLLATIFESGCRTALKEAGVPDDHSIYSNLPTYTASEIAQSPAQIGRASCRERVCQYV